MKIICTKAEKLNIIDALMDAQFCPYSDNISSCDCIYDSGCWECVETYIEWQIENEKERDIT